MTNLLPILELSENWGINTNIFETNVINLAVVIGFVIVLVGDAFKSLLLKRKESILLNLKEAEIRAEKAQELFLTTKNKLEEAIIQAKEIDIESKILVQNEKNKFQIEFENNIKQLEKLKNLTIALQQQKIRNQISQKIIILALKKVNQKLKTRCDQNFQNLINNFYITLFRNSKL
uniref:ATP synthase subunit b, chloroplastic n=1 Tax=Avrainvillea mazei TaxID=381412 RepID=A0A1X9RPS9_9CHLO|nr:ATP synthase CF0 subunit I [Avrainvillea mazei]